MKKYLMAFFLGGIVFGTIGVVGAAILFKSSEIRYENENSEVTNVQDAISEIYSTGDATAEDILEGKTALVQGKPVTGTLASKKDIISCGSITGNGTLKIEPGLKGKLVYTSSTNLMNIAANGMFVVVYSYSPSLAYNEETGVITVSGNTFQASGGHTGVGSTGVQTQTGNLNVFFVPE